MTTLSAPDAFEPDADELWDLAGSAAAARLDLETSARRPPPSSREAADVFLLSAGQSPPPRGHPAERTLRSMRLWRWGRSRARMRARLDAAADDPEDGGVYDDDGRSAGGDSQDTLKMSGCGVVVRAVGGADDAVSPSSAPASLGVKLAGRGADSRGDGTWASCPAKLKGRLPTAMGTPFGGSTPRI